MGGCVSSQRKLSDKLHQKKQKRGRSGKCRSKISASMPDVPMKRMSNASVRDFAVSEYVHLDFEKGGAKMMCKRAEMSNANFHLTQLQWNCSQIDGNRKKNILKFLILFFFCFSKN